MGYDTTPVYGFRTPQKPNKPTIPADLKTLATDVESALSAVAGNALTTTAVTNTIATETASFMRRNGAIPDAADVTTLDYGTWWATDKPSKKNILGLPEDTAADNLGVLEVLNFGSNLRMLRWTTGATTAYRTWTRFQYYTRWGDWQESTPTVGSVAGLTGQITPTQLSTALMETPLGAKVLEGSSQQVPQSITTFDMLITPGIYYLNGNTDAERITAESWPQDFQPTTPGRFTPTACVIEVRKPASGFVFQTLRVYVGKKNRVWVRQTNAYGNTDSWQSWQSLAFTDDIPAVPTSEQFAEASKTVLQGWLKEAVADAVAQAAIAAATGDVEAFDKRYRVEYDGTNNTVFGKDALKARKYPEVRNNTIVGLRAGQALAKGRYNDFFGGEAGYSLDGTGYAESEGKASRNAGFGTNTQRFNKTGRNNVTMGRNSMQCNVGGVNNTYIGAGSAAGLAHMRLSDGVIENQLPLEVWGNAFVGTSTHQYGLGNQNAGVGGYALSQLKTGDRNSAFGTSALQNLGKDGGYNGKRKVDTSANAGFKNLAYSIAGGKLTLTLPAGHGIEPGFMLECVIAKQEDQYWVAEAVTDTSVILVVGMEGFTQTGVLQVKSYFTNESYPASSYNVGLGYMAGTQMSDGSDALVVNNAVAIGASTKFVGDNTVALGNEQQTVHVYGQVQTRSDARDKTDVQELGLGLDFIEALRPVTYRYDYRSRYGGKAPDGSMATARRYTGLIAQEVAEAGDFTGVVDNGAFWSLSYEEMVPVLVAAIKELAAEVRNKKEEEKS